MTLTEQWKNGKLEEYKKYYCKTKWFEDIFQARCYSKDTKDEWWVLENKKYKYNNIYHTKDIEVLAPVPSYEEWKALNKDVNTMTELWRNDENQLREKIQLIGKLGVQTVDLKKENQQLKNLLKEIRGKLKYINTPKNRHNIFGNVMMAKIDEVLK